MARVAALGGDDHDVLAVLEVDERGRADGPALGADVVEQQHWRRAREAVADPPAAGPVDDGVPVHHPVEDGPHPIGGAQVEVHPA